MPDPGLDAAARLLQERSGDPLPYEPRFIQVEPQEAGDVAAVDGSHAVLVDNGTVWVVATRAHIHVHGHPAPVQARPHVRASLAEEAQAAVDEAYGAAGFEAPTVGGAEAFAEAWRALSEWQAWKEGIRMLPERGMLLVDGALEQLPAHAQQFTDRLLEAARGRTVVGVAKRSGIHEAGVPLVPALAAAGRRSVPDAPWASPVPRHSMAHVAQLHPAAAHAFRVDTPDGQAIGRLVPLARDAVYTGYPYPLAKVHNLATITHAEARRLRERLHRAVRQVGGPDASTLLADFHDVLDRNVPR